MKKSELLYNWPFAVVGNREASSFYILVELDHKIHGYKRIKIPLPQGWIEKYNVKTDRWEK